MDRLTALIHPSWRGTMFGRWDAKRAVMAYYGKEQPVSEQDQALKEFAQSFAAPLLARILKAELTRGDSMTEYTRMASKVRVLQGA